MTGVIPGRKIVRAPPKKKVARRQLGGPKGGRFRRPILVNAAGFDVRQKEALGLRISGLGFDAIAEQLGITVSSAYKCINAALDQLAGEIPDDARRLRLLEMHRLDAVIAGHWRAATEEGDIHSAAIVLRAIEVRAKLMGLNIQLGDVTRPIAVADLQALLAERLQEATARVQAVGLSIELPFGGNGTPPESNGAPPDGD